MDVGYARFVVLTSAEEKGKRVKRIYKNYHFSICILVMYIIIIQCAQMRTNAHIYTHKEDSESETCPRERS